MRGIRLGRESTGRAGAIQSEHPAQYLNDGSWAWRLRRGRAAKGRAAGHRVAPPALHPDDRPTATFVPRPLTPPSAPGCRFPCPPASAPSARQRPRGPPCQEHRTSCWSNQVCPRNGDEDSVCSTRAQRACAHAHVRRGWWRPCLRARGMGTGACRRRVVENSSRVVNISSTPHPLTPPFHHTHTGLQLLPLRRQLRAVRPVAEGGHLQRRLRPLHAVVVLACDESGARPCLLLVEDGQHAEDDRDAGVQVQPHDTLQGQDGDRWWKGSVRGR